MSDDSTAAGAPPGRPLGQRLKHGLESKILVPAAATVVAAAASYLAKKLPMILEQKVLPKLQEQAAPEQLTNVLEQASDTIGARSGAADEGGSNSDSPQDESRSSAPAPDEQSGPDAPSMSNDEREEERRQREERRRERKRAVEQAA